MRCVHEGEYAARVRLQAAADKVEGAVEAVRDVGLEAAGCDECAGGEVAVCEQEQEILLVDDCERHGHGVQLETGEPRSLQGKHVRAEHRNIALSLFSLVVQMLVVRRAAGQRALVARRALTAALVSRSARTQFVRGNAALATSHAHSESAHHSELVHAHEHKHEHRPDGERLVPCPHTAADETEQDTPQARYHQLVVHGTLREDEHQKQIIARLDNLHAKLASYNPPEIPPIETHSSFVRILCSR